MGACNSDQVTFPSGISSPKSINTSEEAKQLTNHILNEFTIGRELLEMLKEVSYTNIQTADLAKELISGVISLQEEDFLKDRETVKLLFNNENIKLVKNGQLSYYGMLEKLKDQLKVTNLSYNSKSFIYHTIANFKKQPFINQVKENAYGIQSIKKNTYKELTESELEQIVNYESIADKIRQIGQKIGFRFQSIRKQSQKMIRLLEGCMKQHIKDIGRMKYDLSEVQVEKMAFISRQACNHYDNGVFVLLVYFVQSCKRLEAQLKDPQQIQLLLEKAISFIYKKYPPGQGLSSQHKELIKTLKDLQSPNNYNKVQFHHQQISLTFPNNQKQSQIQKIITKYAQIAEQCKPSFQELVKATCLAKCVYFKIGLKYYPKNPNKKALTRIKEKMFFKKDSNEQNKVVRQSIKQVLQKQQSEYRKKIDEILEKTDRVQFKISDMVRGKCVFLDVADIIYSVNQIKKFVANNPQFGIAQIESRFTNTLPISDVTLKIVLSNKIVAELQLTIQTNAAVYAFAHKIYELQRTKVFSKVKIVHNYYEESKDQFNELAASTLELHSVKCSLSSEIREDIESYFKLESKPQPFRNILQSIIQINKLKPNRLQISANPLLQDLISVSFNLAIGKWKKDIGKLINKGLQNESLSLKLKSVLLCMFFNKFYLPAQSQSMQQFGIIQRQLGSKIYMQEFIRQQFQIEQAFIYMNQNQRLSHRAQQLQQIVFCKKYQPYPIELRPTAFAHNLVIEQDCFQQINQIRELFNFYFITRNEGNQIYPLFTNYSQWLSHQTNLKDLKDPRAKQLEHLNYQGKIVQAQFQIENNNENKAEELLKSSLEYFKRVEDHQKVIECQILLAECRIKLIEQSFDKKNESYKINVLERAKILGLQIKGPLYADSLWRISEYLSKKCKNESEKQIILREFTARALVQMSRSKGKQFVYAIIEKWPQYQADNIEKPTIRQNNRIKYAKFYSLGAAGCHYLSKANWKNLTTLILRNNSIEAAGCEYLVKANWKNMTTLNLDENNIGDAGCEHLSKAYWKNITALDLSRNSIGDVGCKYLIQADWKNIAFLDLRSNSIEAAGCECLSKGDWKNITTLILDCNYIGDAGCEHLSKADWKNITTLSLRRNSIEKKGCRYLGTANWNNITILDLDNNSIGDTGCEYLSKAEWKNLTRLDLKSNGIEASGCEHLSKAGWRNMTALILQNNNIRDAGCEHLSKADWKNLTRLDLKSNQIGPVGCKHLSEAGWKNIAQLDLHSNNIGDEGCEYLGKANWSNIVTLTLCKNSIGAAGCEHLSKADWKNIATLDLYSNSIGDAGCEYLSKADWKKMCLQIGHNKIKDLQYVERIFAPKDIKVKYY